MKKYYPTLLCKTGEFKAISELTSQVKNRISPIFKVLDEESPDKLVAALTGSWTFNNNQALIDFSLTSFSNGQRRSLLRNLINAGVNAVPVVSIGASAPEWQMINRICEETDCRIAIKATASELNNFNNDIQRLIRDNNIDIQNSILIIDLELIDQQRYSPYATLVNTSIASLNNHKKWHSIVVVSGSFLENLTPLAAGRTHRLSRYEWLLWNMLNKIPNLRYGDYGTKHPIYSDTEARFAGSCSVKYTTTNDYVIFRGEKAQNHPQGNGQYINHSNALIITSDYSGATFCWGDQRISHFASQALLPINKQKPGSTTNWVSISQNHHISLLDSLL